MAGYGLKKRISQRYSAIECDALCAKPTQHVSVRHTRDDLLLRNLLCATIAIDQLNLPEIVHH
jgi:hypothetical protein